MRIILTLLKRSRAPSCPPPRGKKRHRMTSMAVHPRSRLLWRAPSARQRLRSFARQAVRHSSCWRLLRRTFARQPLFTAGTCAAPCPVQQQRQSSLQRRPQPSACSSCKNLNMEEPGWRTSPSECRSPRSATSMRRSKAIERPPTPNIAGGPKVRPVGKAPSGMKWDDAGGCWVPRYGGCCKRKSPDVPVGA